MLESLGPTPQAAVRRLMTEFRRRGWHDAGGTAVAIVRTLEQAQRAVPPHRAAAVVAAEFLAVNQASRRQVVELLTKIADPAD
jgi:hypothetical protein